MVWFQNLLLLREIGLLDNNKLRNLGSMHLLFICMDGFSSTAHPLQKKPWTEWFQPAQQPQPKQLIASSHIYKDLEGMVWFQNQDDYKR